MVYLYLTFRLSQNFGKNFC